MTRTLFALTALGAASLAAPAMAQTPVETGDESYNMVIVYGDDACPQGEDGTIVVCARQAESERYRIPEALRYVDGPQAQSWEKRVQRLEMVGKTGIMSCSPVGAGGFTGCTQELIAKAYDDKESGSAVRFSNIIDAQREERLAGIDEEAERTQEEVESIERAYMEKLERERATEGPDEPLPQPEAEVVAGDPES